MQQIPDHVEGKIKDDSLGFGALALVEQRLNQPFHEDLFGRRESKHGWGELFVCSYVCALVEQWLHQLLHDDLF